MNGSVRTIAVRHRSGPVGHLREDAVLIRLQPVFPIPGVKLLRVNRPRDLRDYLDGLFSAVRHGDYASAEYRLNVLPGTILYS